jgi:hypothetical protein
MINKQKLYSITLVSAALILILINIAGAETPITPDIIWYPFPITYGNPIGVDASAIAITGAGEIPGTYIYDPPNETILGAGPNQPFTVFFTPTDSIDYTTATDTIYINITKQSPMIIWPTPANITHGTALSDTQLNAINSGLVGSEFVTVNGTYVYDPPKDTVLDIGSNQPLSVIFTPDELNSTNYTTATYSVSINVTPITPIIDWPTPADITYGTELSYGAQLDASALDPTTRNTVDGNYIYTDTTGVITAGTLLNVGLNQPLSVTFTPTDYTNYTTATYTVYINVNPATPAPTRPKLDWNPQPLNSIVYGTKLGNTPSGNDLDATATDPTTGQIVYGQFAYTDETVPIYTPDRETGPAVDAQSMLSVGIHPLMATFTPDDTINYYGGGTVTNSITVTQAQITPIIQWNNPADILYSTKLKSTQLNAIAVDPITKNKIDGVYVYNPPIGTTLNVGNNQPLSVTFTPIDFIDYNTAKDTVYINVLKTFLPDPNGYSFQNQKDANPLAWTTFLKVYQLPSNTPYNPFGLDLPSTFYDYSFSNEGLGGNCFGMDATSLLTYNNGFYDEYSRVTATSPMPSDWLSIPQAISNRVKPNTIAEWITAYQPLQNDLACAQYRSLFKGTTAAGQQLVVDTITNHLSNGLCNLVLGIYYPNNSGHALIPYNIEPDTPYTGYTSIDVYDCNYPGNNPNHKLIINNGQILPYDGNSVIGIQLIDLNSIKQSPVLPDWETFLMDVNTHLLYTDTSGNKLGYDNGVFKDEILGTCPMISYNDTGNNNNPIEAYYVPDPSIKMELFGNGNGTSHISMGNPNGLIVANVTVSPTSVDEFKILNNGTGIYFNSENDTTQSLGLMLDVKTPNNAQIVNAGLSQIEVGGSLSLSNNNGTIIIQNNGLQRTGNFTVEQMTSTQNSSIYITNIAIERNSTVNIVPSNWNDIGNSTVTINDVGSNGQTYYTEIITYKNGQVTQVIFPSAALTIVKSADPTSYDNVGQTIIYTYKVTNSGNTDISAPITVADDNAGTVPIKNSGILSPGSSVTGTATYKITDADINTGSVTNLASTTGSFNNQLIISPQNIVTVHYKQPNDDRTHNGGPNNGGYGGSVVPVVPVPMMYSSPMSNPMYDRVPGGYGSEPYGYSNEPYGTIETPNSDSNGHKAKAHLSKHKHHTTKHHKTGKKSLSIKVDKK